MISYYFVCKTKLWLSANRLNLEDNSEDVRIGRVLHEINEEKNKLSEVQLGNV
ncbi:MAG: CRISPR-associated protein Cas4, partial [Endomicrobium sp.]|nr:CRISPR-associated protein Cas4 [Endomicrobium sp.]